jgi:invasion protein IalB
MKISSCFAGACAVLALTASGAFAQAGGPPGRPEVKEIGSWSVRCFPVESPSPCDMYEELQDKNTRQRVLSLSLAYVPKVDRHAIQITVPLGVALQKGVIIQTDNFTSQPLRYRQCDRSGCFVQMLLDNASVTALTKSGPNAKVKIVADGGKPFDLAFSLDGFAAAHDSMVAQAKVKAKEPPAPPPGAGAPAAPQ